MFVLSTCVPCSCITQNSQVLLLRGPLFAFGKCVISIFHILDLLVFAPDAIIAVFKESVRYTADVQRHKLKCKDKRTSALTSICLVVSLIIFLPIINKFLP